MCGCHAALRRARRAIQCAGQIHTCCSPSSGRPLLVGGRGAKRMYVLVHVCRTERTVLWVSEDRSDRLWCLNSFQAQLYLYSREGMRLVQLCRFPSVPGLGCRYFIHLLRRPASVRLCTYVHTICSTYGMPVDRAMNRLSAVWRPSLRVRVYVRATPVTLTRPTTTSEGRGCCSSLTLDTYTCGLATAALPTDPGSKQHAYSK